MRPRLPISIVAACSLNRVIGKRGALPWRLATDWAFFATVTRHEALVVGRKSFEEFGEPVPNRKTIVVSPSKWQNPPRAWGNGVRVAASVDHALEIVAHDPLFASCSRIFIGGGQRLYEEVLARDLVESCVVTRVHTHIDDGDVFLPQWTHRLPTLAFSRTTRCSDRTPSDRSSSSTGRDVGLTFQVWTK